MKNILYIPLILLAACETPVCCNPGPEPFRAIVLTQEGSDYLAQSAEDLIQVFFIENGVKKYLDPQVGLVNDTCRLYEPNIPMRSVQGFKDFYLQIGNEVDTLFVDVGKNNRYNTVRFNGEIAGTLPTNVPNPAYTYILIKK